MRIFFLLASLWVVFSCKKESSEQNNGDVIMEESKSFDQKNDPITNDISKDLVRKIEDGQINITIDASRLPIEFEDEFTNQVQSMLIKITNYNKPKLKAEIFPKEENLNIRFNSMALPNGDSEGPFDTKIDFDVDGKGDVLLSIHHSNMAEGKREGSFSVIIK